MLTYLVLSKIGEDVVDLLKDKAECMGPFWFTEQKNPAATYLENAEGPIHNVTSLLSEPWRKPAHKKLRFDSNKHYKGEKSKPPSKTQ